VREPDVGGQLRIDWNHNSRVIQKSESGVLEIEDGPVKVRDELSPTHLRIGSVTYLRTTGSVQVRLLVRGAGHSTFAEIKRFLGPSVPSAFRIGEGTADRSMERAAPEAAPVQAEPERDVRYREPVERPPNYTPRKVRVKAESPPRMLAASAPAPARRQPVPPLAEAPSPAEPLPPAAPLIATNTPVAIPAFIPRLPAPAPPNPGDRGPQVGQIIWTGQLARGGTIQILGNRVSQGHMTGGLPGAPVRVQAFPAELIQDGMRIFTADPRSVSAPEAPGVQNGWNRTVYALNPRKAADIRILEAPGQQNAWNRLILRVERGEYAIIVLRWERAPAESAHSAASNQ
jgi:hypothetical protein